MTKTKTVSIKVPQELFDKTTQRLKKLGFKNIQDYLIFILEEINREEKQSLSAEEEEQVKKKLKALGYIE